MLDPKIRVSSQLDSQARRARQFVGIALVGGLALRLAFGLGYWVDKPLTHDQQEYLALARSLATGQGFRYPPSAAGDIELERFGRAPGYPVFLALVGGRAILDTDPQTSPATVKIAQSVVGAIGVIVIAALAWRIGGPTAGAIGAVLAALYPPLVWTPAYVQNEAVYSVLALLTALVLGTVLDSPVVPRAAVWLVVGAGLLGGVGALIRPEMLVFLGLAAVWLALRHSWRLAGVWMLGAFLVITPWTIRNIHEHGRIVLIASEGGITFWTGNHPLARGEGDMAANPAIKRANTLFRERHRGLTAEALEPLYYREAFTYIREHPGSWVGLLVRKFVYLWVPIGPSYTLHSTRYLAASVASYGMILPFAIAGAALLWRARRAPTSLWLLAGSVVITTLVFFPQERFRIPVLDPTFIVCAAVWLAARRDGSSSPLHV